MFQTTNQMMDHGFSSYFPHFAMARTCRDFLPHFQTHPQTWHRSRMCSAKGQFWQPSSSKKSWTPWTCGQNESCLACRKKHDIFHSFWGFPEKNLWPLIVWSVWFTTQRCPFAGPIQDPSASGLSLLPFFLGLCFCFFLSDLSKDQQKSTPWTTQFQPWFLVRVKVYLYKCAWGLSEARLPFPSPNFIPTELPTPHTSACSCPWQCIVRVARNALSRSSWSSWS